MRGQRLLHNLKGTDLWPLTSDKEPYELWVQLLLGSFSLQRDVHERFIFSNKTL